MKNTGTEVEVEDDAEEEEEEESGAAAGLKRLTATLLPPMCRKDLINLLLKRPDNMWKELCGTNASRGFDVKNLVMRKCEYSRRSSV